MGAGLGTFAAAGFVAFLWPTARAGVRRQGERRQARRHHRQHPQQRRLLLRPEARAWLTEYPPSALPKAKARLRVPAAARRHARPASSRSYQKCPHLGCRVPECTSSQWFECPCHGSQYNRVGEKKAGPAPRGMDHFAVTVGAAGDVVIDTATVVHRCADRHQHHRPGGRRSALHQRGGGSHWMIALQHHDTSRWVIFAVIVHRLDHVLLPEQRARRASRARLRGRDWRRTASRTTTTRRSRARGSSACSSSACCCSSRGHRSCRCTGCSSPSRQAGASRRQATSSFVGWGAELFAHHGQRRLQLRRLPRRHERPPAASAPYAITDPQHR